MTAAADLLRWERAQEAEDKRQEVRNLISQSAAELLLTSEAPTLRWLLCGRGGSLPFGEVAALISVDDSALLVPEAQAARILQEERPDELGYRLFAYPRSRSLDAIAAELVGSRQLADARLKPRLLELRRELQPAECARLRAAGRAGAEAMTATFAELHPDMSEREAAARLAFELSARSASTSRISVTCGTRQLAYTLAPPTRARLGRHAILSVSGEREGLVFAMTRVVAFVEPTTVLASRVAIAAEVEARMLAASVPGASTGEIRAIATAAFAQFGVSDSPVVEARGGLCGYECPVGAGTNADADLPSSCAVSWRPTVLGGGASQDTVLVSEAGPEVVTWMPELEELRTSRSPRPAIVRL